MIVIEPSRVQTWALTSAITMRYLVKALRPKQWPKKQSFVFVCLLPIIYQQTLRVEDFITLVLVAGIFCAISGAAYLINDIQDRHADRLHPTKRNRPIAAGNISLPLAIGTSLLLLVLPLLLSMRVGSHLVELIILYIVLSQIYNAGMKHWPIADVILVGCLYAVRTAAGFVATGQYVDKWYAWSMLSGMVGLGLVLAKRRSEVKALGGASASRRTLLFYAQPGRLDRHFTAVSVLTVLVFVLAAYALHPLLMVTGILILFCLHRVWNLVGQNEVDIPPIDLVLKDRHLVTAFSMFIVSFGAVSIFF